MDDLLIPPLLIQNFTENSIKYAIDMEKRSVFMSWYSFMRRIK